MPRTAGDLMFAAILALLSYAPFEYVAKTTLIAAATLFILDPLPPYSRLIALLSIAAVSLLSRTLKTWQEGKDCADDGKSSNKADQPQESKIRSEKND